MNVPVDADHAVARAQHFEHPIGSGRDPSGIVRRDPVALAEFRLGVRATTVPDPDRVHAVDPRQADQRRGIGADRLAQPRELFLAQQAPRDIAPVVEALLLTPALVVPNVRVLAGAPQARVQDQQAEIAVGHLPAPPLLRVHGGRRRLVSSDQVVHDLEVAPHVVAILAQILVRPDGNLLGALDIVHAVVVIAGIDGVPVTHHLPARGRAAQRSSDDLVGVVG